MKSKQCINRIIFFLLLAFGLQSGAFAKNIKADFFVSPVGSDTNPGTKDKPFATLEKARDAVRVKLADMDRDIIVLLRVGEYFIDRTITFNLQDSGRNGHRVIYKNYPNEKPVLIGGKRITNWKKAGNNLYKAELDPA
ncbi:MAG: right-handed parallel beta-helix repeat-containing protein, partial [Planctomycetota bacterium]